MSGCERGAKYWTKILLSEFYYVAKLVLANMYASGNTHVVMTNLMLVNNSELKKRFFMCKLLVGSTMDSLSTLVVYSRDY